MNAESWVTILVASVGMAISWGIWVSASVFNHTKQIELIQQLVELHGEEIQVLCQVKEVLNDIKLGLNGKRRL